MLCSWKDLMRLWAESRGRERAWNNLNTSKLNWHFRMAIFSNGVRLQMFNRQSSNTLIRRPGCIRSVWLQNARPGWQFVINLVGYHLLNLRYSRKFQSFMLLIKTYLSKVQSLVIFKNLIKKSFFLLPFKTGLWII